MISVVTSAAMLRTASSAPAFPSLQPRSTYASGSQVLARRRRRPSSRRCRRASRRSGSATEPECATSGRRCGASSRVSQPQTKTSPTVDDREDRERPPPTAGGVRDRHGERGRERRADVDPEHVDARREARGRAAKRSLTATGISAWAKPSPRPTPNVRAITAAAPGATARAIPKTPISARQAAIASRVP